MTIESTLGPRTFDDLVGQPRLKRMLSVSIAAARADDRPLPHVLLVGPGGSGKSTVANLAAAALGDPMLTMSSPPVNQRALINKLYELEAGVLFIDEVHGWPPARKLDLLSLMEAGSIDVGYDLLKFPWLTVFAATTEREKLTKPLISRFTLRPPIETYTDDDMAEMVAGFAGRANVTLDDDTMHALGVAAAGLPRQARQFVVQARSLARLSMPVTAADILDFCCVEPDGLTFDHVAYLHAIVANRGHAGLDQLASRLRQSKAVVTDLEQLLLDRELIVMESSGRVLTAAGRHRLNGDAEPHRRIRVA